MIPRWHTPGRTPDRRSWLTTWAALHTLPLKRRIDPIFLVTIGLLLGGLVLLCVGVVELADRAGWLNAWTARPVADERILTNLRDRLPADPLLSAVLHAPEGAAYTAQRGGTVHRYDPRTGLWQTEDPLADRLLNRDFLQLRSGCGSDPRSREAGRCPDPSSLWALNGDGGLARRAGGAWGVVVGDSSLLGQTGQPLENADLTAAAVSADGRWLAVGTRQDGIGLYDVREHRWLPTAEISRQLPSLRVTHLAWWRDRFWIGGTAGLASLTASDGGARVESVAGVTGEIAGLDADPDGSLFVLARQACENGITGCQQLVALDQLGGPLREMVAERRLYPELSLTGLSFAQYAGNTLAVAGQRGVYAYDAQRHAWEQIATDPILATLPLPDGSGFYFAFAGGAGLFQEVDQDRWSVGDERIVRLAPGAPNEALALTERGNVYSLLRNADARLVYAGTGTHLAPELLRTGFAVGTTVVLFGPDGALLHDVARRRYEDVPAANLPDWLKQPGLRFVSASDRLYAILPSATSTAVFTLDGARLADGSYYSGDLRQAQPVVAPASLPDADARTWVWPDQTLGLLATDGSVYRVTSAAVQRLTGAAVPALDRARLLDVADEDGGLIAATDAGLRRYSATRREWSDTFRILGKEIVEFARPAGRLLGRTADNLLVQEGGQGVNAAVLIGESGFTIGDGGLSDALLRGNDLFLGGQGRVERYDLPTRRVGDRWTLAGNEPVAIRALLDGRPLSLTGGQAFLADRPLDPDGGTVRSLSTTAGQIVAVRERDSHPYLKLYEIANVAAARCFFRAPAAEGATRVTDARGFSDGTVAVATDAGLRFYSSAARSWLRGPANLLPHGGRLYTPGGSHLVLVDDAQPEGRLTIAPIPGVRLPESCSTDPVTVQGESFAVRAVAVDEASGRVAWLTPDGAVLEWTPGQTPREILAPAGDAPAMADLRRVYVRQTGAGGTILATTDRPDRPLWRYDLAARRWTPIQPRFPGPVSQIVDLNVERAGDTETVLAQTDGGNAFVGTLGPADPAVTLTPVFTPSTAGSATLGAPASSILDVQDWGGGRWTFLLPDRIRTYDPGRRTWTGEAALPSADPSAQLGLALGRAVVTAENGRAWLVGTGLGETPPGFARAELRPGEQAGIDGNGTVWRLLPSGEVTRCDLSNGQFACRTATPAPATLDPAAVLQAFEVRPELFAIVGADGVRGYDPRTGQWADLPPAVAALPGPLTAYRQGARLLLLGGESLAVLTDEGARGLQADTLSGVRELVLDDLGQAWVRLDDGWQSWNGQGFTPTQSTPALPPAGAASGGLPDRWPTLQSSVAATPGGVLALDPVTRLEVDQGGALLAVRPTTRTRLADRGALQVDPAPPLNVRWLQWDRQTASFVLAGPNGPVSLSRSDLMIGDRLLWEVADAFLAERADLIHVANARGVLTYRRADLLLTDQNTVFQPLALAGPIVGAHGRFTTPAGEIPLSGGRPGPLQAGAGALVQQIGDVTLREEPSRGVAATLALGGSAVDALAERGFLWDADRRGLAFEDGRLLLQSAAGVHPVDALAGFDGGPNGLGTGAGRLRSEGTSGALLDGGAAGLWRRADAAARQWQPLPADPALNRPLLDDAVWSWRLADGQIGVALRGDAQAFAAAFGPDGFGFTSDRLLTGSAHAGRLHLMTVGLFEIADTADALKGLAGRRLAPSPADTLEDVRFADGSTGLFRRAGGAVGRLDDATGQFQAVSGSADPYATLPLVAADRLRLTRTGGQTGKELRLDLAGGGSAWAAFSFVQSGSAFRFPFDVVTSVATVGNDLYVGTAAGLAVSAGGSGLADVQGLYALSDPSAPGLAAVTRVGQPLGDPSRLMARSAAACIERSGGSGAAFAPCRDPALLDERLRVQNAFWQWSQDGGGEVRGWYRDLTGRPASPLAFANGRLPHDALADAAICDGKVFTLWQSGWLTGHAGSNLSLSPPVGSTPPGEQTPRRLVCLAQPIPASAPGTAVIAPGLYGVTDDGRWLIWSQAGWSILADATVQQRLEERRARPPIFERQRLRLLPIQDGVGPIFEQQALDGHWQPISWSASPSGDRRLAIDRWSAVLQRGNDLWAATEAGLVRLGREASGRALLDPDTLALIREPRDGDRPCTVTDLEATPDGLIRARCGDSSTLVFSTAPGAAFDGQRDSGLFSLLPGLPAADPFAERTLIAPEAAGRWRWQLTGRRDGQPGTLTARWLSRDAPGDQGEDLQIVGGRFTFDRLSSVALARAGTVEVGTDAGWIQAPRSRYHALDLRRPDVGNLDPTAFDAVSTTRVEQRTALCLRATVGGYLRLFDDGSRDNPQACPQHLADDDLWRYERDLTQPGLLPIRARGGGATRQLRTGRFTDDLVLGLPVTSLVEGRPGYLLPTQAGVLRLDERLTRTSIVGEGFSGLAASVAGAGGVPATLAMLDPTTPAYVGDDGLYRLEQPGASREPLPLAVPRGARLLAVEDGPFEFVRIRWTPDGPPRPGISLISRDAPGTGVVGRTPLDVADYRPFTERRAALGNASPWLWVEVRPNMLLLTRQDTGASQTVGLPPGWTALESVAVGGPGRHRLLLIGTTDVLEVNLDRLVEELYAGP
ncbi:MAG: hypothetical protein IT306_06725 [Chloroflexi bacterium]|nr:hypothetical protein [Chloroflexota bacterium]